jgi:acetyl esterase/lipase
LNQAPATRAAIAAMGYEMSPEVAPAVRELLFDEQTRLVASFPPTALDIAYGEHPRQVLDVYAPGAHEGAAPILVWLHGGGFTRGEKRTPGQPFNAHAGSFAAANGFLGVVMNYRLAPEHTWPSGGEDIALLVDWLRANAASHGGDAGRIVLMGTSAGAVHIGAYLALRPGTEHVRGAVLLSGIYGFAPFEEREREYYSDPSRKEDLPNAIVSTAVPLFVACAEFDPPRMQAEMLGLLQARLELDGRMPRAYVATGHNHFSIGYHLGGPYTRLSDEIVDFVRDRVT